jgi:DNA topoisomerase IB
VATLNSESANAAKEAMNVWWETEYEPAIRRWTEMPKLPKL